MGKITRAEAGRIARKRILKGMQFTFDISSKPPTLSTDLYGFSLTDKTFKDCWYVVYRPHPEIVTFDGEFRLLCVSKKTGKIVLDKVLS